jgi:hypothetical protein
MMKKLLALLVVLGLTSLAGAELIFTINGEPQPEVITVSISEEVTLGLHLSAGETIKAYQITYSLSNEQAEFLTPPGWTNVTFPWASDAPGKIGSYDGVGVVSWVEIAAANIFEADPGPLTLMQGLILHCLNDTPVTMTVTTSEVTEINGEIIPIGTILHTLDIIQVPEPMTIALLGFGGAILSRFRRGR